MKPGLVADVLTTMFHQDLRGYRLMRANMLALEIERNDHTLESIKQTSAYLGCKYDIDLNDNFLQSLLDKKKELCKI